MFILFADFGCTESDEHCRRDQQEPKNNGLHHCVGEVRQSRDVSEHYSRSKEEVEQRFVFVGLGHKFNG